MNGEESGSEISETNWKQLDIAYNLMDRMDRRIDTYINIMSMGTGFLTLSDVFLIENFLDASKPLRMQYTTGILALGVGNFILAMLISLACCIFVIRPYKIHLELNKGVPEFSADTDFSISENLNISNDGILSKIRTWEAVKNTKYAVLINVGNIIYAGLFAFIGCLIISAYVWGASQNYSDFTDFYKYAIILELIALFSFLFMWLFGKRLTTWFYNHVNRQIKGSLI